MEEDDEFDGLLALVAATPRRHAPPRAGDRAGRYELRRLLGRGTFGDVYEARHVEHRTIVALKRLKGSDPGWVFRFKREFRVFADLTHPNLVKLYELFAEDDHWYLTMELIDGTRFDEHVTRAPESTRSCFSQLAHAIGALHEVNCLHRDVKPSNVLVERGGRVVLLDFGLALPRRSADRGPARSGTPLYMAPELAGGIAQPSEASDWYAFGVMLYEALAGRPPFDLSGADTTETAVLRREPPPRPSTVRPGCPADLEDLAMDLLLADPDRRPDGAAVLAVLTPKASASRPRGGTGLMGAAIVGRERELATIEQALVRSRSSTSAVTLHGLPGIGKSSVARASGEAAMRRGAAFYAGRCHETESVPFKGLDGVMDSLCEELLTRDDVDLSWLAPDAARALGQMFPVLRRLRSLPRGTLVEGAVDPPHVVRRTARAALRDLLAHLSRERPVAVFIDDLQWANDDSIDALLDLLAPGSPPLLLLVSYRREGRERSGPLRRFLDGIAALEHLHHTDIPLEPLPRASVEDLLLVKSRPDIDVERALAETGGHPYLLTRLADARARDGVASTDLAAVLAHELDALSAPARQLLEVLALSATRLSQQAAFSVIGWSWNPIVIDELRRARLVQSTDTSGAGLIEPYHDRVTETVVDSLDEPRRRELHLKLATFLETRGRATPDTLAHHYRCAGQRALALHWTRRAAVAAQEALAFARAAEHLRAAVDLSESSAERVTLLEELGEARVRAGHRADAGRAFLAAATLAEALGREADASTMRSAAGEHFLLAGDVQRGISLIGDSLRAIGVELPEAGPAALQTTVERLGRLTARGLEFERRAADAVPPRDLRRLDLELAVARALAMTDVRAAWLASLALADALDVGEPQRVQRAMALLALAVCAMAPDHPLVVECVTRSRRLAEDADDGDGRAWASFASAMWNAQRAEFPVAVNQFRDARARFSPRGSFAREAATATIALVVLQGNYGLDIHAARREDLRVLDDLLEREDLFAANWARVHFSWLALVADDPDDARERLAVARRRWPGADQDLFASSAFMHELAIALYDDAAGSWAVAERVTNDFARLMASRVPANAGVFHRLSASSAVAAFTAGRASAAQTAERIAPSLQVAQSWKYGGPMTRAVEAFGCLASGDPDGYRRGLEQAAAGWAGQAQQAPHLSARLRLCQHAGDDSGARAAEAAMRALGVVNPNRYSLLFAGPNAATA